MLKVVSALELLELSKSHYHIPTGCKNLDRILGGGIRSSAITDIHGLSGSGKTQLSLELILNAVIPCKNTPKESSAVYVSSKKCFFPDRIADMIKQHKRRIRSSGAVADFSNDDILKKIFYKQFFEYEELAFIVHLLNHMIEKNDNENNIRLIVIDSFSFHIRDIEGWDKMRFTFELLGVLSSIATNFNIAVVITCDMTVRPVAFNKSTNEQIFCLKPALGDPFLHRVNQSIELQKNNKIIDVSIKKSLTARKGCARLKIDQDLGIMDIEANHKRKALTVTGPQDVKKYHVEESEAIAEKS